MQDPLLALQKVDNSNICKQYLQTCRVGALWQECFIFHLLNSYNKPERLVLYYPNLIDEAFRSTGLRNGKNH